MHFLKALGRGFSSLLLKFCLFTLAIVAALLIVFGTSTQLKHSLKDSGIYNSFVDSALDSAQKSYNQGNSIPLDRPEIRAAAKSAITPEFLQSTTNQAIDSIYGWLNSDAKNPDFRIDLGPAKQNFANALGNYAVARAQTLPACTLQQARQLQFSSIDPYNVPCLPPGFNPTSVRSQVVNSANNDTGFLDSPVINADTLAKNNGGQSPFEKADKGRQIYHWVKIAPYVLASLVLISTLGLIFLYDERRRGLRAVGIIFLGTGVFLFASTWLYSFLFAKANSPSGPLAKVASGNNFQQNIIAIIRSLNNALNHWLFIFCAVYVIVGVWILLTLRLLPKKPAVPSHEDATAPPASEPGPELPPPHKPEHKPPAEQKPVHPVTTKKH